MLRYGISEEQIEEALDTPDSIAKGDITTYKARSERYEI